MAQVGDPVVKGFEMRMMFIESKLFQIMSQNDVLITQVDSMEKVIINKEEKIEILQVHAKKQDDNMEGLKLMFKNILEESENLAFSLSLVEQRGEDVAAKNRREMLSEIARAEARLKLVLKEADDREINFTEGSFQTVDRVAKIESEIKTIYKWLPIPAPAVSPVRKLPECGMLNSVQTVKEVGNVGEGDGPVSSAPNSCNKEKVVATSQRGNLTVGRQTRTEEKGISLSHGDREGKLSKGLTETNHGGHHNRSEGFREIKELFIGNLPHNCPGEELLELFTKYGKVEDVRITQKSNHVTASGCGGRLDGLGPQFGFVVFEQAQSVTRALEDKPILLYGLHRLSVEQKISIPRNPFKFRSYAKVSVGQNC